MFRFYGDSEYIRKTIMNYICEIQRLAVDIMSHNMMKVELDLGIKGLINNFSCKNPLLNT